jgi:hypothetical protein
MTKTTFSKQQFLMLKYCQNKLKFHLVVEKDRGNTWEKKLGKKISHFFAIFY